MGALDLLSKIVKGAKQAPFFSKADEVLEELQRGKGTGDEFLTEMVKKGAKPTELKERGIEKALKGKPKMTKADVKKVFEDKPPPKVQETVYGDKSPDYDEFLEKRAQERFGADWWELSRAEKKMIEDEFDKLPATKYEKYKTPGGENYREILLKLPAFDDKRLRELEAQIRREESSFKDPMQYQSFRDKVAEVQQLKAEQAAAGQPYTSSHWPDEPNVLAHIRVQDFKTPEGKKVLLVDEIQSDWHQAGRKEGYRSGNEQKQIDVLADEYNNLTLRRRNLIREAEELNNAGPAFLGMMDEIGEITPKLMQLEQQMDALRKTADAGVPDAPFKKNWHELAMKRVLDYAAENGYDTVAITPGAEQAKRYDLSKHINDLEWDSQTGKLTAWDHSGNRVISQGGVNEQNLSDYIGKEAAQRLLEKEHPIKQMFGADLQVGGEGMKGFYDKILLDYLNNYGKPYGAGVGEIDLITKPEKSVPQIGAPGIGHFPEPIIEPAQTLKAHRFDITPQMREQIKTKGQPLYSKIGAEAAAGTGAVGLGAQQTIDEQPVQNPVHFTENPDAMLLELMQRN